MQVNLIHDYITSDNEWVACSTLHLSRDIVNLKLLGDYAVFLIVVYLARCCVSLYVRSKWTRHRSVSASVSNVSLWTSCYSLHLLRRRTIYIQLTQVFCLIFPLHLNPKSHECIKDSSIKLVWGCLFICTTASSITV